MDDYYAFAKFILIGLILNIVGSGVSWYAYLNPSSGFAVLGSILLLIGLIALSIGIYNLLRGLELHFVSTHRTRQQVEKVVTTLEDR